MRRNPDRSFAMWLAVNALTAQMRERATRGNEVERRSFTAALADADALQRDELARHPQRERGVELVRATTRVDALLTALRLHVERPIEDAFWARAGLAKGEGR